MDPEKLKRDREELEKRQKEGTVNPALIPVLVHGTGVVEVFKVCRRLCRDVDVQRVFYFLCFLLPFEPSNSMECFRRFSILLSLLRSISNGLFLPFVVSTEKARLHAEAKAAEMARRKAEAEAAAEAKRKREAEREAARIELQRVCSV